MGLHGVDARFAPLIPTGKSDTCGNQHGILGGNIEVPISRDALTLYTEAAFLHRQPGTGQRPCRPSSVYDTAGVCTRADLNLEGFSRF